MYNIINVPELNICDERSDCQDYARMFRQKHTNNYSYDCQDTSLCMTPGDRGGGHAQ